MLTLYGILDSKTKGESYEHNQTLADSPLCLLLRPIYGLWPYLLCGRRNEGSFSVNVGRADSTLITCGDHAMLIDAGKTMTKPRILSTSRMKGRTYHLDYMIRHASSWDHIGSMDSVIDGLRRYRDAPQ